MLFSSIPFIFWFLPITLITYYVMPKKGKNFVLLLFSMLFYYLGEPIYLIIMMLSVFITYLLGFVIEKAKNKKIPMILSVSVSLAFLLVYKYADFFIENINHLGTDFSLPNLVLPIGISFYTFQAISYTIDLYRGDAKLQKSFINFACYITFFPQLIAGPIVRYTVIEDMLNTRKHSIEKFSDGAFRFSVGLGKKVLIANVLGEFCEYYISSTNQSMLFAWAWIIAFTLQIYFDFSGYSDMAIGLSKLFGFDFPENFNYPFISSNITEFWRRWHISLGTWFRDYVYIPMGGNRVKFSKWILNIFVVWFLTGFWHGAEWNFIIWGIYFAVILVLEKLFINKYLEKSPRTLRHIYTTVLILFSFMIFASTDLNDIRLHLSNMFNFSTPTNLETKYYIDSYLFVFVIAIVGATPIAKNIALRMKGGKVETVGKPLVMLVLLTLVTAFLVQGSYNPFLYFRF